MKKKIKDKILNQFETDLSPMDCRLFREETRRLRDDFLKREKASKNFLRFSDEKRLSNGIIEFLVHETMAELECIRNLRNLQSDFNQRFASSNTQTEKKGLVLRFAKDLGASPGQLRGDKRAFNRWFGYDAVLERCTRKISETEYRIVFLLNRLGAISTQALTGAPGDVEQERILNHINMEKSLKPLLAYKGDERVRIETFRCMAAIMGTLSPRIKSEKMEESIIVFIYRASLDVRQQIWIQCETLALLSMLDPASFIQAAVKRLFNPAGGDDFFVRRKAVQLLCDHIDNEKAIKRFVPTISRDISPFVRQAVPPVLVRFLVKRKSVEKNEDIISWLRHMLLKDISPQVRASAILEMTSSLDWIIPYMNIVSDLFSEHFSMEKDSFVLRVGFKTMVDTVVQLKTIHQHPEAKRLIDRQLPLIMALHQSTDDLSVRRWAACTRERLLVERDEDASLLMEKLNRCIPDIKPGGRRPLPKSWFHDMDDEKTGRVLSVLARGDFSLSLQKGFFRVSLFRGDRFRFRLWRFLHELFSSSPDKRQGFSHIIGRKFSARLRAPSAIGSELTQTKVPGEPLYFDTESGWRPYLPLVDEMLSCSKRVYPRKPDQIFTAEGITEIHPPRSLFRTWFAYIALTFGFSKYAKLRNWQEKSQGKPDSYINALRKLGFQIDFAAYQTLNKEKDEDPSVVRFFTFAFAFPLISPDLWNQIQHYFFSAYENSLYELGLFAALLLVFFLSKHLYYSYVVSRARKKINLVIGGWGTRGKSGVERLKASVFEALGHGFINKTTGCEAMFLHARPYGKTREMFLFRPYDKATIWEHHHLICMTRKLRSKMFLWECMALTPAFVSVLQQQWTRDDYSTITNTYPDHEDIQGPAGIDIPQVMTNFIPKKGRLITSEEEMTPILTQAANEKQTEIEYTGWLESGILTPDVLGRFPYEEHPSNVALVLKLCQILNIDPDFAVREMADRVVPDIGALKVYPPASIRSRRLEFINGMSANERFATISNWRRMGFEDHDYEKNPETILSTLVNNRADRIPRSRMFASIIVEDLRVDYHFLIGSNLSGMLGFINTAWENALKKISIHSNENDSMESSVHLFRTTAGKMRIPTSPHTISKRITAMLEGLQIKIPENEIHNAIKDPPLFAKQLESAKPGMESGEIIRFIEEWTGELKEFQTFQNQIQKKFQAKELETEFKKLITKWFRKKLILIDNIHVSGNQIINTICHHTPPGLHNRIMGLQNIKGPGLDYVYRWQAWEKCYLAGEKLLNDREPELFEQGFYELTSFQDYGILCEDYVLDIVSKTMGKVIAQTERYQAGLSLIKSNLENAIAEIKKTLKSVMPRSSFKNRIAGVVESILDAGDAVKRRKKANRIYKDLIHERISHERAAIELKKLNQRQKGGWLNS